jgi:heme exporter protein D
MKDFQNFLYMGGFAFYVWGAYGLALAVIVINLLSPWLCRRRSLRWLSAESAGETIE